MGTAGHAEAAEAGELLLDAHGAGISQAEAAVIRRHLHPEQA